MEHKQILTVKDYNKNPRIDAISKHHYYWRKENGSLKQTGYIGKFNNSEQWKKTKKELLKWFEEKEKGIKKMSEYNYYESELNALEIKEDQEYKPQIKFFNGEKTTKYLSITFQTYRQIKYILIREELQDQIYEKMKTLKLRTCVFMEIYDQGNIFKLSELRKMIDWNTDQFNDWFEETL